MALRAKNVFSQRVAAALACLGGLMVFCACASAQAANTTGDYLTDIWTAEDGLPDNSVTAIAQTPDGYLWVGTFNGLARFDGVRFVTFDPANTPALLHARVRQLYVDRRGALWINTYDGSLTAYRHGKFELEWRNTRLSEGEVTLVASSSNQVVFLMNRGEILCKSLASAPGQGWKEWSPPHRGLGALCCQNGQGILWYRDADRNFYRVDQGRFIPYEQRDPRIGTNINCLAVGPDGRLWAGTDDGLAAWEGNRFENVTPTNSTVRARVTALAAPRGNRIWAVANGCVCEAAGRHWVLGPEAAGHNFPAGPSGVGMQAGREGGMWFYNYGSGLIHVTADGAVRRFTAADGFPGDRVYCGFVDQEGDLWTGWDAGGLVRTRKAQFHTINLAARKAAKSVSEDAQGAVWIGLLSGGLDCLQNQALTNLPAPDGTPNGPVYCVCPDRGGRLWASGQDEDLYVREGRRFRRVMPVVNRVKAILAARNGRVWIGTTSGLYFSDGASDRVHFFAGMARHSVRALAEDSFGTLWAGSGNGDLYHIVGDKVSEFHPPDEQESDAIWSVLPEEDGTVWVGTFRDGLMRFRGGKFFRYGKANGLPDNVICQILDDGAGNLWIGSHRGVFRIGKRSLDAVASGKERFAACVAYGRSDGLPSLECSGGFQPSGWRGADGRLWFTTSRGVAWVQPREIHPDLTPPPVVIEEVLVDGELQTNFVSEQSHPVLNVPPGNHQIEIHYTGLSLVSPEHVRFRYQLEGVNTAWVQAGTRRFAQYSFLPPGKYRFRVVACNSDGVWNKTGSEFTLNVLPFYYQTWWFQALAMAAILCVVAGVARRLATRRLHAKMEQLERHKAVERERARIAKDIHDDLGASLTLIALLGDLAKREKTNERIERMSGTARDAVKSLDEIVWAVNPRNDTLSHLVDYTGQFSAGYLRDAGIRCLLEVPDHLPAREVPANVRHNVFLAVKEALQNIVKHARATEVLLRVDAQGNNLHLTVEDNGCGFERPAEDPWADGLRNMRQRLAEVGGTCRIDSHRGAGTTIRIELPLPSGNHNGGRDFIR